MELQLRKNGSGGFKRKGNFFGSSRKDERWPIKDLPDSSAIWHTNNQTNPGKSELA